MSDPRLQHPKVAAAAGAPAPAFVVAGDGGAVVWANAAAEALIGGPVADLPADAALARQLRSVAAAAAGTDARLGHLRVPGARLPLTCRAEPLTGDDGTAFVLLSVLDAAPGAPAPNPATADAPPSAPPPGVPEPHEPAHFPLRVLWQSDPDGKILFVSPDLGETLGAEIAAPAGRHWSDFAAEAPDGADRLARAFGGRDTWSGLAVVLPAVGGQVVRIELSGLPMFDRDRAFQGFRGFGVVREGPHTPALKAGAPGPAAPDASPAAAAEPAAEGPRPALAPQDRSVLREIARALSGDAGPARTGENTATAARQPPDEGAHAAPPVLPSAFAGRVSLTAEADVLAVLDALPAAVLIHRLGAPLFANRAFLELAVLPDLPALAARGLESLLDAGAATDGGLRLSTGDGRTVAVEGHLKTITWEREPASLLTLRAAPPPPPPAEDARPAEHDLEERLEAREQEVRELHAILDTAADGVVLLDAQGRVVLINRSAEALFGYEAAELEGRAFTLLLATESQRAALDYLESLRANGVASVMNDGREVLGMVRRGGAIPLFMTMGRIGEAAEPRFCAVLRDLTPFERGAEELRAAKAEAERATAHKSAFLSRMGHEIRTPLNAILGFAELMIDERFGPIASPRYKDYLKDIHASGEYVISLVNDLLDLSKIEAGRLDLTFTEVNLNEVLASTVALLQPEANTGRIIIRTSLAPKLPAVKADLRSLKQIVHNLLSNAVKFTPAGGQVIVSTALTDLGQAVIRMRDTGAGMSESEVATAFEPFGQVSATTSGSGLGLPLTKALVEANKATFALHSQLGAGTLVEVIFPPSQVLVG